MREELGNISVILEENVKGDVDKVCKGNDINMVTNVHCLKNISKAEEVKNLTLDNNKIVDRPCKLSQS